MSEKDREMMFYIFYNMYLQYICNYHYRRKSHKSNFLLFYYLCSNCINILNFFSIAAATRYRSNNLSANHSEKIVHIQLSRKGNKITGEHHLKADIMPY